MNQSYRLVWNEASGTWVAVAETTRGRGKRVSGSVLFAAAVSVLGLHAAPALANPPSALQLPAGAQVVAGSASLSQSAASLTVTQSSNRAAVDWASFDVGSQARVIFNQPDASSVTLNRVQGSNPSQIFGQISATGQVFLSNPAGVYFAPGSSVDVAGLVATTHGINNADFMAGSYHFERSGASGSVVNQGQLHAGLGGYIALLAPEVRNGGVIVAQLGTVALAAGEAYTLQFDGNHLSGIVVTPATIATLVDNAQAVQAPGGLIILSAQAANQLQGSVVNTSGTLEARGLALRNGRIVLDAGVGGTLKVAGTLDASNASGQGGDVVLSGRDMALLNGARLDASGAIGGGSVLVGGDWQGSGDGLQATHVRMEAGSRIDASATGNGSGGKVVLWSDVRDANASTEVNGSIVVGNGRVETSGHTLSIGAQALVAASGGGQWLLDPANVTISTAADSNQTSFTPTSGASAANVNTTTLVTALNAGTNVTVTTTNSGTAGAGAGTITVSNAIATTGTTAGGLSLTAASDITLGADITLTGTATTAGLTLSSGGAIGGAGNISASGGTVSLSNANAGTLSGVISGSTNLSKSGAGTLTLSGNNTYSGSTTISAGTLQVGNGGASGSLGSGAVVDNASLVFNRGANTTLAAGNAITGSGNLSSSITGTLTTSNTINVGGAVNLAATGDLNVAAALTYGADSSLTSSAGNLLINGAVSKTAAGATTLNLNATAAGKSISLFADVKDSSASSSTLNINTTTLYNSAGSTSRTLKASNLQLNFSAMAQANFGYVTFDGDSWLHQDLTTSALSCCGTSRIITFTGKLNSDSATTARSFTTTYQNVLSFGADVGGVFRLKNFVSPGSISAMAGNLYTDGTVAISTNEAANLAFFGIPGSALNLTKTGTTLIDSNNHDVSLLDLQATGTGARDLSINAGSGNVTLGSALYTTAKVLPGNVTVSGQNITVTGAITKTDAANSSLSLTASNSVNINAAITASGAGQLATTLSAGSGTASGAVNGSASGAINTNGGLLTINQGGATGNGTLAGVVSGSGGLTVTGPGSTTLTGANSYTGTTTISAGTLQVGNGGSSGSLGTGAVADNANLVYNLAANTALPAGNTITGSGNLSSSITGTLTTNNSITLGGTVNLQATGDITVAAAESSGGASTFNSTAGNVNLNANTGTTGAGAALLVKAAGDIVQAASTTVQTNGGTITYNANSSGTGGAIELNTGASVSSQGGNIALGGGVAGDGSGVALGHSGRVSGINVNGASVNAAGGNVSLRGQGAGQTSNANFGVEVQATGTVATSGAGNVSVTGTGGGSGGISYGYGVYLVNSGQIRGGGSGNVTVQGQGATGSSGYRNAGVVMENSSTITSAGGPVQVSGQGGSPSSGTGDSEIGVWVTTGSHIEAGGSGDTVVSGTAGAADGSYAMGVVVQDSGSRISAQGGNVRVTGVGAGTATGNGSYSYGVAVQNTGLISATGAGTLTVQGTGGASGGGNSRGVQVEGGGHIEATGTGSATVSGTAGVSAGIANIGVYVSGSGSRIGAASGGITVTGSGTGNGSFGYGVGVENSGTLDATGSGAVLVQGTGGANADGVYNVGVMVNNAGSAIASAGGPVTVSGTGGGQIGGSGNTNIGVWANSGGRISAGGTGALTVTGTGGYGSGGGNRGVLVYGGSLQAGVSPAPSGASGVLHITGQAPDGLSNGIELATGQVSSVNAQISLSTDSFTADAASSINAGTAEVKLANRSAGVQIDLGGADVLAGSQTLGISNAELDVITAGLVTIGRNDANASGTVTVSAAISPALAASMTLDGGGAIAVNNAVTVTDTLTLRGGSGATVGGAGTVTAPKLALLGSASNYSLAGANAVGTVAATAVGSLSLDNAAALAVGTVGATNGIQSSGDVTLNVQGNSLSVGSTQGIGTSNGNITLVAGRFVNGNPSASTLAAGGSNKYWQVWSSNGNPFGGATPDQRGNIAFDYKQYGATYGSTVAPLGNGLLYTYQPAALPMLLSGASSKTYDGGLGVVGGSISASVASGLVDGDTLASFTPSGYVFADPNAGANKQINMGAGSTASFSNAGHAVYGYTLTNATNQIGTITRKSLTVTGLTANSRTYDGTTSVVIGNWGSVSTGVGSELLVLNHDTASFATTGAGSNKTVTAIGYSLADGGAGATMGLASNYSLGSTTATTLADITQAALNVTAPFATKPYDGNTTAPGNATVAPLAGAAAGEVVNTPATLAYTDKNAGLANKTVQASGLTIRDSGGADVTANYAISYIDNTASTITPKVLDVSGSRVYDGSASVAANALATSATVGGETLGLTGSGLAIDKNVGTAKALALGTLALVDGTGLASNYTLVGGLDIVSIAQAALNVSAPTVSKTYDALVGASGSATVATLAGAAAGEVVNTPATLAYTDKNAGLANKTVQASGLTIRDSGGADVTANYAISYIDNTASTITPKVLDVSGSRVYDGSASVAANALATSATVGGETLGLTGSGLAIDKNVGTAKALALGTLALVDGTGLASNYTLVGGNDTVSITPRPLSLTGSTGIGKTYDGTTSMPLGVNGYGSLAGGVVSGDALAVSGSPVFSSANTGPRTIGVGSVGLAGADRLNYTLGWSDGSGTITPAALTMTANAAAKVVFDTDPSFSAHYDGFVNGETASVLTHPTVTRPRLGLDESAGSYANALVPSASSSNYSITPVAASFTIAPVGQLLITVADGTKVYGDALPSLGALSARYCPLSGCVGASSIRTVPLVHGSGNSYTFDDGYGTTGSFLVNTTASSTTPVGNIPITVANFAASILTNFSTQTSMEGTLTITQRPVTPTANNVTKVYDGLLTLPATLLGLGNRVGSDNLSFSGSGVLADKNVGSNKAYSYGNLSLLGPDSGNYYLSSNTFSASNASVTPRPLTVTGSSAADKVYDATPFTSGVAGTLQGLVGTETLLASVNYAQFNDAHAGSNKAVTLHYALADGSGLASNYSVADGASTANISRRPVNVAANAQSKNVGQSDPTLTYATEAATSGTGLVLGEQLAGMLDRDPGEAVGAYRINQGSLNNANNPDYAVAFQSAQLAIHAIATTPTPAVSPTPPQPAAVASPLPVLVYPPDPIPESRNTSEDGGRAMLDPGNSRQGLEGTLTEPGILVALVSQPQRQAVGLIVVEIPGRLVDESRSLNFALPPSVADNLVPLAPLRITTLDGQDMPAWLRYDTNSRHFVATRVPRGALPLQLLLESSDKRWLIQVTQRSSV